MTVIGSWRPTVDSSVYTAGAISDGRVAVVPACLSRSGKMRLLDYAGSTRIVEARRATQATATNRLHHLTA